jgi:mono/diheme cytochrome c family protein
VYNSLQHVADSDLRAMAVYLRSLSAVSPDSRNASSAVGRSISQGALDEGRSVYVKQCADCHGQNGEGHAPVGPPLAANRAVTMNSAINAIRMVLFGGFAPGTHDNPRPYGMPPYYPSLSDEHIADVLTYVRSAWGNGAGPVLASEVTENRGSPLW